MKKIYSSDGEICIDSDNNYYFFHNYKTSMSLKLCKKDIRYFLDIGKRNRFLTIKSYSNFRFIKT